VRETEARTTGFLAPRGAKNGLRGKTSAKNRSRAGGGLTEGSRRMEENSRLAATALSRAHHGPEGAGATTKNQAQDAEFESMEPILA